MNDARDLRREMRAEAAKRWRKVAAEREENLLVIKTGKSPDTLERKLMVARHADEMTSTLLAESARAKAAGISDWLIDNAAERVVETPDFDEPKFLEVGLAIGRAVCMITVTYSGSGLVFKGTGFLVAPGVLLTNYHVIRDASDAQKSLLTFDYQNDSRGQPLPLTTFALDPGALFISNKELDYALVAVGERLSGTGTIEGFGWMPLVGAQGKVKLQDPINAIQHPEGGPKQWVLRNNPLILLPKLGWFRDPAIYAHYKADTLKGSSGAPMCSQLWEVFALHHMAVPDVDEKGNILDIYGNPYSGSDESLIKWVGNEGIRVSALVRHFEAQRSAQKNRRQAQLLESVLQAARPDYVLLAKQAMDRQAQVNLSTAIAPQLTGGAMTGRIEFRLPLKITIELDGEAVATAVPAAALATNSVATPSIAVQKASPAALSPALAAERSAALSLIEAARSREKSYFDTTEDDKARDLYYADLDFTQLSDTEAFSALSELLISTHTTMPAYKPATHVYPWVELRKDRGRLVIKSIYSGKSYDPREFIEEAFALEARREEMRSTIVAQEAFTNPEAIDAMLEAALPYNCEHVVPQSWFYKREPMRGDIHHLFACESGCNSFRGNHAYFDFPDYEALRDFCGMRENNQFEPAAGKGAVARATLYFLLRYPKSIDLGISKMNADRIEILKRWHVGDVVDDYERHRNQAIFEIQGNRNPLIDFPAWVDKIDFALGLPN